MRILQQVQTVGSVLETIYQHCPNADILAVYATGEQGASVQIYGTLTIQQLAARTNTPLNVYPHGDTDESVEVELAGCRVFALQEREDS